MAPYMQVCNKPALDINEKLIFKYFYSKENNTFHRSIYRVPILLLALLFPFFIFYFIFYGVQLRALNINYA